LQEKLLAAASVIGGLLLTASAAAVAAPMTMAPEDLGVYPHAPLDIGWGPGVKKGWRTSKTTTSTTTATTATTTSTTTSAAVPAGDPTAGVTGHFDPPVTWPIIGLHEILLPDGRVLNYGTNTTAQNTLVYDVWTPSLGFGSDAHSLLPNTTKTDIFCGFQSLMTATGQVLITGGDVDTAKMNRTNNSNNHVNIFSPQQNTMQPSGQMVYARWYASAVAMPNGELVVLAGRVAHNVPATTPEAYNPTTGWRGLDGATSDAAFGNTGNEWHYPRGFVSPRGDIFIASESGAMWSLNPTGSGTIASVAPATTQVLKKGIISLPTVMYAPGKLLSLRLNKAAQVIDINGAQPVVANSAPIDQIRYWSTATVLADGEVAVTGGSSPANSLTGTVDYTTEIWNPGTGKWTAGAVATIPRLYHSIALLLPDATLLTGAGGDPGPVEERNAEVYYPPYLYLNDGSGQPAPRPTLASAPTDLTIGNTVTATVGDMDVIGRVTFVRAGSITHTINIDQRFLDVPFTQSGSTIVATPPSDPNVLVPGYYMMFVFQNGVPSVAKIIRATPPSSPRPTTTRNTDPSRRTATPSVGP
jgi:hypothetical protein